jgi:TonB-dependent starch-binding outer membrane protein SusC
MKQKLLLSKAKLLPLLMSFMLLCTAAFSQKTVTGKVTNSVDNQPLAGATVIVKGTTTATATGNDGAFTISVPAGKNTLVITSTGFDEVEVDVRTISNVEVALKVKAGSLNEVVVTGYSTQRKKDIIGAVSVVNVEDLKSTPSANIGAQLQGRATGVTVSGTGAPGSPAVVRIRGFQSFGNNEPLYVIDGVPTQDPSILNPQDVESMQVLKDGTATAIYGTRGANGVVIVTTRQGRPGRAQVSYETFLGTQNVTQSMRPEMLDNQEYMEYLRRSNAGTHPVFGPQSNYTVPDYIIVSSAFKGGVSASDPRANPALYSLNPLYQIVKTTPQGTNHFDEMLQAGFIQSHQISANGGTDKATYSMGLNYIGQEGTIKLTNFNRYSVRLNSSVKATNWLRFGENAQVSYTTSLGGEQRGEGGAWSWAYRYVPYIPSYDINGGFAGNGVGQSGNGQSPISVLQRNQDDQNLTTRLFGNIFAEVQPVKWLTVRTSIGVNVLNNFQKDISRKSYERAENQGTTQLLEWYTAEREWTWTNLLTFQKTFAAKHDVKVQLGTEAISRYSKISNAFGQNFDLDNADFIALHNAGTASGDRDVNRGIAVPESNIGIFSQFGRLDYAFNNRYLFNATVRRDEASVLGKANPVGYFPSVGFGWRVSEEDFMKNISWITDLKLRGGYGSVGSISNLPALNPFTTFRTGPGFGNYDLNGTNTSALLGYRASTLGNDSTKWENTVSKNIGFDLTVLNGKWVIDFNLYKNDTKDLLVPRQPSLVEALRTQPYVNVGTMVNKGFELSVLNRGKITKDLNYDVQVNFSTYKNEVTKLNSSGTPLFYGLDRFSNAIILNKGLPISTFWGYQIDGFYNTAADVANGPKLAGSAAKVGTWKYVDRNKDGNINGADAGAIGNPHPKFQMGFNIGLDYKAFDFSAFLFWNSGNDIYNYTKWYTDMRGFVGGVSDRVLYDSWTTGNNNAKLPLLQDGFVVPGNFVTGESNSYYIEKGSYLRAKNIQIGKIKLQKIRAYVQAQNLFTITKYTGADPDLSIIRAQRNAGIPLSPDAIMGIDQSGFPNPKQFLFGLNVTF